jgi:hypothetical protein
VVGDQIVVRGPTYYGRQSASPHVTGDRAPHGWPLPSVVMLLFPSQYPSDRNRFCKSGSAPDRQAFIKCTAPPNR